MATATGSFNVALSVQCPAGKIATGGGGYSSVAGAWSSNSAPLNSSGTVATSGQTPTGWTVQINYGGSSGTPTVYAICAS